MNRVCYEPGCGVITQRTRCVEHQRAWNRKREQRPGRQQYKDPAWRALSQEIRREEPQCRRCGNPAVGVDHPTLAPLCAHCHGVIEARRRAQRASVVA